MFQKLKWMLLISLGISLAVVHTPSLVHAETMITSGSDGDLKESSSFDPFAILSGPDESTSENLVKAGEEANTKGIGALILKVINILSLLLGTFGFILIMISGFLEVTANGDEGKIDKGKQMLTPAILGLVVGFLSYFIVLGVQSLFYE